MRTRCVVELLEARRDILALDDPDVAHAALVLEPRQPVAIMEPDTRVEGPALGRDLQRRILDEVELVQNCLEAGRSWSRPCTSPAATTNVIWK